MESLQDMILGEGKPLRFTEVPVYQFTHVVHIMEVIRTVQTVKNGQVLLTLPSEFSGQQVEIIVLTKEHYRVKKKSFKGALQMYAKPELITMESRAWENAVEEKYGNC